MDRENQDGLPPKPIISARENAPDWDYQLVPSFNKSGDFIVLNKNGNFLMEGSISEIMCYSDANKKYKLGSSVLGTEIFYINN